MAASAGSCPRAAPRRALGLLADAERTRPLRPPFRRPPTPALGSLASCHPPASLGVGNPHLSPAQRGPVLVAGGTWRKRAFGSSAGVLAGNGRSCRRDGQVHGGFGVTRGCRGWSATAPGAVCVLGAPGDLQPCSTGGTTDGSRNGLTPGLKLAAGQSVRAGSGTEKAASDRSSHRSAVKNQQLSRTPRHHGHATHGGNPHPARQSIWGRK